MLMALVAGYLFFQAVPYVVCTWKGQSAFRFGALEFTASVGLVPSECMLLRFSALHVVEDHKESKYPNIGVLRTLQFYCYLNT